MITYQNEKIWQRPWFLALVVGLGVTGSVAWWMAGKNGSETASAPQGATNPGWVTDTTGHNTGTSSPSDRPVLLADGRPSDINEADWNALKGALAKQPNAGPGEAERVVDYLRYQHRFEYWQTTEGNKSARERAGLAEALLAEIPDRLKKGEFTAAEAVMMNTVLLTESEPNETARQQRIAASQEQLLKIAPPQDNEKLVRDAERATEYKRLLATTFADWQSKPPEARTQIALEQAMADAQRTFNAAGQ